MKKTILFYVHNFGGLGHNKRISLIIRELLANFPNYNAIILNSGKEQDYLFSKIEGLQIINLPNYEFDNYELSGDFRKTEKVRKLIYKKIFSLPLDIESLVIEHYPFGRNFLDNEIRFLISEFRKFNKRGGVFSSVRDIVDINSLNKENLDLFDRFLFHSDRALGHYENEFDKNILNKVIYTGYVTDTCDIKRNTGNNTIYINIGGGQDGIELISDFLSKFDLVKSKLEYKIIVSLGENYNKENIDSLQSIFTGNIEFHKFLENSLQLKIDSILVVSMGGYNNMVESLRYNIRTIVYPRNTDLEQNERLKRFQDISGMFFSGFDLTVDDIEGLLLSEIEEIHENTSIKMDGSYFSASFLVNYKKYKYTKIRLTNACNARCDMCGVIKRKWEYNRVENMEQSIQDFYRLGGEVVNFTGGEPTIYKGFWELLEMSKELGLITSVSTNGSTLGDSFFKNLLRSGKKTIDYIDISVDGLYEKQDIRRGYEGLFDNITKHIPKLIQCGIPIHINVTVRADNINEIHSIYRFFQEIGILSISFGMITESPINNTTHLIPSKEELRYFYQEIRPFIGNGSSSMRVSYSPDYVSGDFNDFISSIYNRNTFSREPGKECSFINSKYEIRINENGDLSPCCEIDNFEEDTGNINTKGFLDILCSKRYNEFLHRVFPNISQACLHCKIGI